MEEPLEPNWPPAGAELWRRVAAQHQIPPSISAVAVKICGVIMREIEFVVPRHADLSKAARLIETMCAQHGLILGMKGSQSSYPGSVHWHYKRPDQKGTLELTLFARERRIWAQVQEGRKAPWIDEQLPALRRAIERALKALVS